MIESISPADAVILNDPNNVGGSYDPALVANIKQALDVWTTHLTGIGTLVAQINVIDYGQNNFLATGGPTLDAKIGSEDGRTLVESGAVFELATGRHINDGTSDIVINVNASYLSGFYLGGDGNVPSNMYDGLTLFEHEIAHGLGIGAGFTSTSGSLSPTYETMWDHYLANINGNEVFTGANATAVNGGTYVNVTTLNNGEGYAHLANNSSDPNANDLMTGLGLPMGTVRSISNVDLAILADTGAPITGMAGSITVGNTLALSAGAGTVSSLGSLTLADTGALTSSTVTVTLTDTHGALSAINSGDGSVNPSPDGHTLSLTGSLADVQAELASVTYTSTVTGTDTVNVSVQDSYGNSASGSLSVATTATPYNTPTVLSLTATSDTTGPVGIGHKIRLTLTTSGPVTVSPTGAVNLLLSDGGKAAYNAALSTQTSLVFDTTVLAGQSTGTTQPTLSVDLLDLTGGATITDINGAAANLGLSTLLNLGSTGLVVDGNVPFSQTPLLSFGSDSGLMGLDHITNVNRPTLNGAANVGEKVVITDTFGGVTSAVGSTSVTTGVGSSPVGLWSLTTSTLGNGVHSLVETVTNAVGNVSAPSAPLLLTIDTVAPLAPTMALAKASDSGVPGDNITSISRVSLSGTAEAGSLVSLYENGTAVGGALASSTGSWSAGVMTPLSLGANLITATATDVAGNVSSFGTLGLTLIASDPVATQTSVTGTTTTGSSTATTTSVTGTVTGTDSGTGTVTMPATPLAPFTLDNNQMSATTYTADQGTHFAVVNAGTASIVANAASTSAMTVYGNAGTVNFTNGGGSGLVVGSGSPVLNMTGGTQGSTLLAFTGTGATTYTGGAGTDEVISGGGNMSLTGGTGGSLLVFGGVGTLNLMGGQESDMIIGGAGAETIHAGLGAVFGGTGGSLMYANGAGTFLAGNVAGDQLNASSIGGDILAGGAGNETLTGAGSANGNIIFAGAGADLITLGLGADTFAGGTGSDTIQAGAGNATLYLGSGAASLAVFTAGSTGGTDTLSGFRVGTDHLSLRGYAGPATLSTTSGSTMLGLSDGTKVILQSVTSSNMANLVG